MPVIYLIRHGQASFGAENYDALSDHGWEQSRRAFVSLIPLFHTTICISQLKKIRSQIKIL